MKHTYFVELSFGEKKLRLSFDSTDDVDLMSIAIDANNCVEELNRAISKYFYAQTPTRFVLTTVRRNDKDTQ
jgi:hypothetical protein